MVNGRLPAGVLTNLSWEEAKRFQLRYDAAESLARLAAWFEHDLGEPLFLTDAYRTYAEQVALRAKKGKWAAIPGTSVHGLGLAADLASHVNEESSRQHKWMDTNAPRFGWINPAWAADWNPNNGQHEPWHWEYRNGSDTFPAAPPKELVVTDEEIKRIVDAVWARVLPAIRNVGPASAATYTGATNFHAQQASENSVAILKILKAQAPK